ncbi:MAG: vitamin K epoxide reductase family protein [Flavobacteriaceae bacterium]|nr:vitamin K epoxide reductase family protein [Flavobacteriaceae bacterium]
MLGLLEVKHTKRFLEDNILSHPDHPSLLSICDTLGKYNIENVAAKTESDKLNKMPLPCIVQLKDVGTTWFCVLSEISETEVVYFNQHGKPIRADKETFLKAWTGVCLLVEVNKNSAEPNIESRLKEKRFTRLMVASLLLLSATWVTFRFVHAWEVYEHSYFLVAALYFIVKILGLTVTTALLWYEIDKFNPVLQNFCSGGGKKVSCDAVLDSKYAKVFNSQISLSTLGFSYFFSTALGFLIFELNSSLIFSLSLATVPIIFVSAFYQAFLINRWCKFCIAVQGLLAVESAIVLGYGLDILKFDIQTFTVFLALFLFSLIVWKIIKPLLNNEKQVQTLKRGLGKIKNNPSVLEGLLTKSRKIETNPDGLGLVFKNTNPKYHVLKVCNPYCGPCAKAHPVLDDLYRKGIIDLQVIFTVTNEDKDIRKKPVAHFLAIAENADKDTAIESLDKWYTAEPKDYDAFAKQYPMNGELQNQSHKIALMQQWCEKEKITHTPTIFINGQELPREYLVDDLKEVLAFE